MGDSKSTDQVAILLIQLGYDGYCHRARRRCMFRQPGLQHPIRYPNGRAPLLQCPPQCADSAARGKRPTYKVPILRFELHSGKAYPCGRPE